MFFFRRELSLPLSGFVAIALLVAPGAVWGQPAEPSASEDRRETAAPDVDSKARADRLFQEGRGLIEKGRFAEACARLEESLALDVAGGTLLNLSQCYEATGRFASADRCLAQASALARDRGRTDATEFIERERGRLAPRIDRLTIALSSLPANAVVTLDGTRIDPAGASSIPVDPGHHVIVVRAPNHETREHRFDVGTNDGEGKLIEVRMAPLAQAKQAAKVDGPRPPRRAAAPPAKAADDGSEHDVMIQAGAATTAVGGAALVVGGIFGILAAVTWSEVEDRCPDVRCDDGEAIEKADRASLFAGVSTGLLIGGGVTGGVGIALIFAAPAPPERSLALRLGGSF